MKALMFIGPLYLTLLHVQIPSPVTATRIFCRAPPVPVGDPATLTCHYPEDLSQSRKGIGVARRDSIPGSQYGFLLGCIWVGEKLRCGVCDGYQLITQQPTYDVTFQIPSHQPGTFCCDYIPEDEAVTVEACNFTLKGRPPSTVTPSRSDSPTQSTERSLGRNEAGDRPDVTNIVLAVVLPVIVALAVIFLIVLLCRRRLVIMRVLKGMEDVEGETKGENQAQLTDNDVRLVLMRVLKGMVDVEGETKGENQAQLTVNDARLVIMRVLKGMVDVEGETKGENQAQLTDNDARSAKCSSPLFPQHWKSKCRWWSRKQNPF